MDCTARAAWTRLPPASHPFALTVVPNRDPGSGAVVARTVAAGAVAETCRPLDLAFPDGVYSLSHIALPFPLDDGLYGLHPDPTDDFAVALGAIATRGERNVLAVSGDELACFRQSPLSQQIERLKLVMRGEGSALIWHHRLGAFW